MATGTQVIPWSLCLLTILLISGCGDDTTSNSQSSQSPGQSLPSPPPPPPPPPPPALNLASTVPLATASATLDTGFYRPTDDAEVRVPESDWLASNCGGDDGYVTVEGLPKYHLGADIRTIAKAGSPVHAIASGKINFIHRHDSWGPGNYGIFVEHTLHDGRSFLALYGHIRPNTGLKDGDPVTGGLSFATIGPLMEEGRDNSHLHLGIVPGSTKPTTNAEIGWGRANCSSRWLGAKLFNDSFSRNKNLLWNSEWELRGADFSFVPERILPGRIVQVWHATYKTNPSYRFVTFFDPDTNTWNGWSAAGGRAAQNKDVQAKKDILNRSIGDTRFRGGPDPNTFTDPIAWLTMQVPAGPLNAQAKTDITSRASSDSRFAVHGDTANTFGADVNWHLEFELRWMDVAFVGGRTVRIYLVTRKADTSDRSTIFWDPDQGNWASWVRASTSSMYQFLSFPLKNSGFTDWKTAPLTSIMDHAKLDTRATGEKYVDANITVRTFNGESTENYPSDYLTNWCPMRTITVGYLYHPIGGNVPYSGATDTSGCDGVNTLSYNGHNGFDYAVKLAPVYASATGVVTENQCAVASDGTCSSMGRVILKHTINVNGVQKTYYTWYVHLSKAVLDGTAPYVVGQTINEGQQLGLSGKTGADGFHLHFEVRVSGNGTSTSYGAPVDPFGWYGSGADPLETTTGYQAMYTSEGHVNRDRLLWK